MERTVLEKEKAVGEMEKTVMEKEKAVTEWQHRVKVAEAQCASVQKQLNALRYVEN